MAEPKLQDYQSFLATPEPAELGPNVRAGVESQQALEARLKEMFRQSKISDDNQTLVRALVLLWHDHLDAAHTLAQEVEHADGSFVHGIMHRREPDYGNAKYWFHRVGRHASFPEIARHVKTLLETRGEAKLAARLVPQGEWNPMTFVDACEAAASQDPLLREVQRIESAVLLARLSGS